MRKEVKPAVKCECCGATKEYPQEQTFCDQCGKLLPETMYPLKVDVSMNAGDYRSGAELCSWKCVRQYIIDNKKQIDKSWYVSLEMPVFRNQGNDKQHCDTGANFYKDFMLYNPKEEGKK